MAKKRNTHPVDDEDTIRVHGMDHYGFSPCYDDDDQSYYDGGVCGGDGPDGGGDEEEEEE